MERLQSVCGEDEITKLNDVDYKRVLKRPRDLELNTWYNAEKIRKIGTDYGASYVIFNDTFYMYLPQRYTKMNISEFVPKREFAIFDFYNDNRNSSPRLQFRINNSNSDVNSIPQ